MSAATRTAAPRSDARSQASSNRTRKRRWYPLRELSGTRDPDLIGLRDPDDPTRMNTVKRPGESAKGAMPKPS